MWLSNTLQAKMPLYFHSDRWADTAEGAAQVKRQAEAHIAGMARPAVQRVYAQEGLGEPRV